MKLGLYCNWGIKKYGGEFYVSSIHKNYIDIFQKYSGMLYLLSKTKEGIPTSFDIKIEGVEIIAIPHFDNYIGALKYFFCILKGMHKLLKKSDFVYIRVPEPFGWLPIILKIFHNVKIHYHYVSFPFDVISAYKVSKNMKFLKKTMYLPEYYLTVFASYFNSVSCMGNNGKNKLSYILRNKAVLLYEASYTRSFRPIKQNSSLDVLEKVRFLYVGRLVPGKGLEELIESIKVLQQKEKYSFSFTIAGDGSLKKSLEKLATQYKLKNCIGFIGEVSFGEELDNIYSSHDVLVSPSLGETGPRVVLEAASNFLYVVSTDVGYVREIFCDETGCACSLVEPGNIGDLVKSFEYIFNNKIKCKKMAEKSEKIARFYTLDTFVESIINLYR